MVFAGICPLGTISASQKNLMFPFSLDRGRGVTGSGFVQFGGKAARGISASHVIPCRGVELRNQTSPIR